jgi:peptide chain release factor 1
MSETTTNTKAAVSPLIRKLDEIARRHAELEESLNDQAILTNPQRLVSVSKEKGKLDPVVQRYRDYQKAREQADGLREMAENKADPDMAELAVAELPEAEAKADAMLEGLKDEFVAAEDKAVDSFFIEIRAGTGGDEAALFAGDLFEMYRRYCESKRWQFIVNDFSPSERGGFKEVIVNVKGDGAYRHLRFEGGGHRVQRVPETETQGRIHTSAATVAVLPELPDVKIEINPKDVEEFGCRGGGPGGQNVNKVETGWFIRHKPSGLQFKMTEHKSQTQNKERAWALLRATLYETERAKQHANLTASRKAMMGSGDRSQRIRTYNFPQNRCTDHRLGGEGSAGEKNFNLDQIIAGQLDPLIHALWELDKQQRLEEL